jgi:hypothetical protein
MSPTEFDGDISNDDRLFVLAVCKCTVTEVEDDLLETVIYHENAPAHHSWAVVTYRNTARYPISRIDHFTSFSAADAYRRSVEPTVPLVSLWGGSPTQPMSFEEFSRWKEANHLQEYDYRKMYRPGGTNPREVVLTRRREHRE